jgi:hypothetical protein
MFYHFTFPGFPFILMLENKMVKIKVERWSFQLTQRLLSGALEDKTGENKGGKLELSATPVPFISVVLGH